MSEIPVVTRKSERLVELSEDLKDLAVLQGKTAFDIGPFYRSMSGKD